LKLLIACIMHFLRWLGGAVIFVVVAWCFLMFAEDGAEPTPQVLAFETLWFKWSLILSVPLGYPVWQITSAVYDHIANPPYLKVLEALTEALGKCQGQTHSTSDHGKDHNSP